MSDGWETISPANDGWETISANAGWEDVAPGVEPTAGNLFRDVAASLPFSLARATQGIKQSIGDFIGDEEMSQNAAAYRKMIDEEEKKNTVKFESPTAQGVYGGVKSTVQAVPGVLAGTANPLLGVGLLSAQTGGDAYGKYRERGGTKEEALAGGALEGTIEGATELLPMSFLVKRFGKEGAMKFIGGLLAREVPGEQIATLAQDAVDTAIANPDKTWEEYLQERPGAAYQTLLATLVQSGIMGGASKIGSKFGTSTKGGDLSSTVEGNLDNLDKAKEDLKRTQGEGPIYVGNDQEASRDLSTRPVEDPAILDKARTELQNNLQAQVEAQQKPQEGLFAEQPGHVENQLEMPLRTVESFEGPDQTPAPIHREQQTERAPVNASPTTPEFQTFFKNSKVVDSTGQPQRVYTGTSKDVDFKSFKSPKNGIWFTTKPEEASQYAVENDSQGYTRDGFKLTPKNTSSRVLPVYLSIQNPKVYDSWPDSVRLAQNYKKAQGELFNSLKRQGYDGVKVGDTWVAFDPKQIKSATGNSGKFDPTKPDINAGALRSDSGQYGHETSFGEIATLPSWRVDTNNPSSGTVSLEDALAHFGKKQKGSVDFTKKDILKVLPFVTRMLAKFAGKHGITLRFDVGQENLQIVGKDGKTVTARGSFDPNTKTITIARSGFTDRVVIHEIIHALTNRFVEANPNHPATKRLLAILEAVRSSPHGKEMYGSYDVHELMAEAFSSRSFKMMLSNITTKVKGKLVDGLTAFNQTIAEMFGARKADNSLKESPEESAFAHILTAVEDVTSAYADDVEGTDAKWKEALKNRATLSQLQKAPTAAKLDALVNASPNTEEKALARPINDATTAREKIMRDVIGNDYIPPDPKVTPELIEQIKGESDGSSVWALTPGALARATLSDSTLVSTIYHLADNGVKRGNNFGRNVVDPVQKKFGRLLRNPQHAKIMHNLLMREMKRGADYTTEELRQAGVPEAVAMAHLEFRAMMQEALELQNKVLRDKGLPEVSGLEAYISARWSGPWRANVRDADGKIVWQVAESNRWAANKAVAYIKERFPKLVFDDVTYRQAGERGNNVEAGYLDMLKLLDPSDPRTAALESVYKEWLLGGTEDISNQEKHHMRKTGVRGHAGDRGWSSSDTEQLFVEQFQYAKNAAKWAEMQEPMAAISELLNNKELQELQKNNIAFSKEYVKNQLGFGTLEAIQKMENLIAKAMGISPTAFQSAMASAKSWFYLTKLGLSVPFTITQFLQPAITTPAWHTQLSREGYWHNPIITAFRAIGAGAASAAWHYSRVLGDPVIKRMAEALMSPLELEATKYLEANQIIDINPLSDIRKEVRPRAVNIAAAPFEFTIKHSEIIARSQAFMGFISHLAQSGQYDTSTKAGRHALFQKAEDMVKLSMTDYRRQERAIAFERLGLTGDAMATLHSYQINNLMQVMKFYKEAKTGNMAPLFTMIAMQGMAAGVLGLWFLDDLDDLIENLKTLMPHDMYLEWKDFSLKNTLLNKLGDGLSYGAASKIGSNNIHTRMGAGDQIPVWPFESDTTVTGNLGSLVPFAGTTGDLLGGAMTLANPDAGSMDKWQAAYGMAPTVAQGPMETTPPFKAGPYSLNPKDLTKGKYVRTEREENLRKFGFKSTEEQKFGDKQYALSKIEMTLQKRLQTEGNKSKEFLMEGDMKKAVEHLIKYEQLGGELDTVLAAAEKSSIERMSTELDRRMLAGDSKASVLKLQRYLQIHGNPTNR